MNKAEAQIRYWGDKFFPHIIPSLRYQLMAELLRIHSRQFAKFASNL